MSHKAFRASLTLVPAGYIAPRDPAPGGDLPLGLGRLAVQAVALDDDPPLPLGEALLHISADLKAGVPGVQVLQHVIVHAQHVHQGQGVPLPVRVQGVRQGDLPLELPLGAEIHQDLILDAPGGIGGQADVLVRREGGDALDEPDGADGDQVVLPAGLRVVLLHDVGHQPEVVLDEDVPGLLVSCRQALQALPLLRRLQRPGERAGPL